MYRDLTENKPPLGYWLYALAWPSAATTSWRSGCSPFPPSC